VRNQPQEGAVVEGMTEQSLLRWSIRFAIMRQRPGRCVLQKSASGSVPFVVSRAHFISVSLLRPAERCVKERFCGSKRCR
jgi:hypothetical protein